MIIRILTKPNSGRFIPLAMFPSAVQQRLNTIAQNTSTVIDKKINAVDTSIISEMLYSSEPINIYNPPKDYQIQEHESYPGKKVSNLFD